MNIKHGRKWFLWSCTAASALVCWADRASAQRVLGLDISAWQGNISQATWNDIRNIENRQFVIFRSSRGGTTGYYDQTNADNNPPTNSLSQRYDDPYFVQNMNRATEAGIYSGSYHFSRPDIIESTPYAEGIENSGADEADHFIEMAGAFMRPGYLLPVHDFEAGINLRTDNELAQFCLDFANRIYDVMGFRPAIYTSGSYAGSVLGSATNPSPTQTVAASPVLWSARWPNQNNPSAIDVQNSEPKDSYEPIYGPWDDRGVEHPWVIWQYASTGRLQSFKNGNENLDFDVFHGDTEYLKDYLVPALWTTDESGDWSTLANWNSGKAPVAPVTGEGQVSPIGLQTLPTPRLPGAEGTGITAGQNDTVVLERTGADITVTLSTGTHNVRKLFMREALNITGGSLTINYDPNYNFNVGNEKAYRSGPISAQFSGAVSLGGSGSLSVNTLQVDALQTFTLAGSTGALSFNKINLMPHAATPAKIAVTGNVSITPLTNATATINSGAGAGASGYVDLSNGIRSFDIGNGAAVVDVAFDVSVVNGGLTKTGLGTLRLGAANTFTAPVTINAGTVRAGHAAALSNAVVVVNNGATLDLGGTNVSLAILASGAGNTTGVVAQGNASLTVDATVGMDIYRGKIIGSGAFNKNGASTQVLSNNNTLGAVSINGGALLFNGVNTTGTVIVENATLGGTGSVSGTVILSAGAHLAPGASIESFGAGALTLKSGSILDIELGAGGADRIDVAGLLNIVGGSVNVTNLGGMAAGTYTLIDYGTRTGNVANLGTPSGPGSFNYKLVDTGSAINLLVSFFGDFNADGTVNGADYVVWRNGLGTVYTLAHYDMWRANFGKTAAGGSGVGGAAVPEPAATLLVLLGSCAAFGVRRPGRA